MHQNCCLKRQQRQQIQIKPQKVRFSGPDARAKRQKLMRAGEKELERRVREVEAHKQRKKPEDVELKNLKKSWSK